VVNDYADSDADTLAVEVCTAGASCATTTITMDVAAVNDTQAYIVGYASCGDETITIAVTNWENEVTTTVITEGVDYTAETDDDTTAENLCPIINAIHGISSTVATDICPIVKTGRTRKVTVATSEANCATVTNYNDATSECITSDEVCALTLKKKLELLLSLGTASGFSVTSPATVSDTIGFVPDVDTTELNITVTNSANDAFATATTGTNGNVIIHQVMLKGDFGIETYDVDYVIASGRAALGPTAPDFICNDSACGLSFDTGGADIAGVSFEMPDCWDGTTDPILKTYWFADHGDAVQKDETVIFDYDWRSLDWGTEDVDNGTAEADTVTWTETQDPADDDETYEHEMTLTAATGDQTIVAGDVITGLFTLDSSSTYTGEPAVHHWEMTIRQTKLKCDHR